jgi:uncharacterized protein (TIGR01777 family)
MHLVVAGASGFLGTHLTDHLRERGHDVTRLVRRAATQDDESEWHPERGQVDTDLVGAADVVVNLAGSPTIGNPHSSRWARELRESRVTTTRLLAGTIAAAGGHPAFLAGNAIAWYGDHGEEPVTEESDSRGDALLTRVTREWQQVTEPAAAAGSRVCVLRTSPVMHRDAPPLRQLRLLFKAGLGARLGSGDQWMPMTSLRDWLGAVTHLAQHPDASGPFNLVCPRTPTNAEFTKALGRAVHRPTPLGIPGSLIRIGAGKAAPDLLGSVDARPAALVASGYRFADEDVDAVLADGLG